jgi:ABC-type nitrate/sulfonate/bicarbonate transport system substrate-binding protein
MSNPSSVVLLAAKGVALQMIGLMDYDPFMAVGLRSDSPVKTPKDLEGKKVGQTLSSSDAAFFPVFCQVNGVDISKVERLNMDAKVRNQSLGGGQVDAITGLVSSMLPSLSTIGVKTKYFTYGDYGVNLYGNIGIAATPQMLKERPEICQAFMDGLAEGLHYTITDPKASVEIFLDEVPELRMSSSGPEFARFGMGVQRAGVLSTDSAKVQGIGWADPAKMEEMAKLVVQYQLPSGTPTPKVSDMFTNKFAGHVKLTDAEWIKAKQDTADIEKILRAK